MEINTIETLNQLFQKRKRKDIAFSFSELSDSENEKWEKKILKEYYACGCKTGSLFLMVSLITTIAYLVLHKIMDPAFFITPKIILYALLIVFIASGMGKAIGLFIAKLRLTQNIRRLKATIAKYYCPVQMTGY